MKHIKVILVFLLLVFILFDNNMTRAQSPTTVSETDPPPISPAAVSIQYNTLYAPAASDLWLIDTNTATSTYIGPIGYQGTDIAFEDINLFGVSFSDFLSIDPTTGIGYVIGHTGYNDVNALTIALDGDIYAATLSGALIKINRNTGTGTLIGYYGPGLGSSGDLVFRDDGVLFASVYRSGYSNSWLTRVNLVNGTATPIGDIGFADVWGLSYKDGELYGVTAAGDILKVNTSTGRGTRLGISTANFWGLSTSGKALTGSIISPLANSTIGPVTLQFAANASYAGGNGVKQVEFYVFYDRLWHSAGIDTTPPYLVYWQTPNNLNSQQLQFRIDVVGNDNQRTNFAGGIRRVNFIQSNGGSNVVENWLPVRAYLNQRSLTPDGDSKCSASSMAMVLAMEGFIGLDYLSMANKANEMYPNVLLNGTAYVYKMRDELRRQGAESEWKGPYDANTAWPYLKTEIDSGRPVILRPAQGVLTSAGHFVVGVGYQEADGKRLLITYDPFGRWLGKLCNELPGNCSGNYDINAKGDPTSYKGQWVYYDFDKLFSGNDGYLITARNPSINNNPMVMSLTPPDSTSDEPPDIGTYPGIPVGNISQIYLPFIIKNYTPGSQPPATGFNSQFNGNASGWQSHSGSWTVDANFYSTTGVANAWAGASYNANFSNFDYQAKLWRNGCSTCASRLLIRATPTPLSSINDWYSYYSFNYTTGGYYSVWKRVAGGSETALQNWAYSSAIAQGSAWNTLRVVASGTSLRLYINGTLVWTGTDSALTAGRVGLGMYKDTSSNNQFFVDWATLSTLGATALETLAADSVSPEQQALNDEANQRGGGSEAMAPSD